MFDKDYLNIKMTKKTQQNDYAVLKYYFVLFTYRFRLSICDAVAQLNDGKHTEMVLPTLEIITINLFKPGGNKKATHT